MSQSKTVSAIESVLNVGSGLLLSAIVWVYVGPLFGYLVLWGTAVELSGVFTFTSMIRSFLWRRLFENYLNDWLHKIIHGEDCAYIRHKMQQRNLRGTHKSSGSIQSLQGRVSVPYLFESDDNTDAPDEGSAQSKRPIRSDRAGGKDTRESED